MTTGERKKSRGGGSRKTRVLKRLRRAPVRFRTSLRKALRRRRKDIRRSQKIVQKTLRRWGKIVARWRRDVDRRVLTIKKRGWNQIWAVAADRASAGCATPRDRILHDLAHGEANEVRALWRAYGDPEALRRLNGTEKTPRAEGDQEEQSADVD